MGEAGQRGASARSFLGVSVALRSPLPARRGPSPRGVPLEAFLSLFAGFRSDLELAGEPARVRRRGRRFAAPIARAGKGAGARQRGAGLVPQQGRGSRGRCHLPGARGLLLRPLAVEPPCPGLRTPGPSGTAFSVPAQRRGARGTTPAPTDFKAIGERAGGRGAGRAAAGRRQRASEPPFGG